jgi:hypothetical protein
LAAADLRRLEGIARNRMTVQPYSIMPAGWVWRTLSRSGSTQAIGAGRLRDHDGIASGGLFLPAVPELTRGTGIKINERV